MQSHKPYLNEDKCTWFCYSKDVAVYLLDLTYDSNRQRVRAQYRPVCTSCVTFLLSSGSEYHKPFKKDVHIAVLTQRLIGWQQ